MVNLLLFQYKSLGSIALRCGASHFGFRSIGHFNPLQQLVIIFKSRDKRSNFLGWLYGAMDRNQYYHREVYHRGQRLFLVFINSNLFINSNSKKSISATSGSSTKLKSSAFTNLIIVILILA
jgi:hypothetical protein